MRINAPISRVNLLPKNKVEAASMSSEMANLATINPTKISKLKYLSILYRLIHSNKDIYSVY